MRIKIIISLLILSAFSFLTTSSQGWNVCIPDGCSFGNSTCGNNECENKTVAQHLSERDGLFNAVVGGNQSIILAAVLLLLIVVKTYFKNYQLYLAGFYYKYKLFDYHQTKLFDYLIRLFSRGILNPKVY